MIDDRAIKNTTTDEVRVALSRILGRSGTRTVRYIKDRMSAYITATAAPSVAVNTPNTMPPMTTMINPRLGTARQKAFRPSLNGGSLRP